MKQIRVHIDRFFRLFAAVLVAAFIALIPDLAFTQIITLSQNAVVTLRPGVVVQVNGSLQMGSGASLEQVGAGNIYITNDWTNNGGSVTPGSGTVTFLGDENASINGTSESEFNILVLEKPNNPTDILSLDGDIQVNNDLLLNDGIFRFVNTAARTVEALANFRITAAGTMDVDAVGIAVHGMEIQESIYNEGTLDLSAASSGVSVTFSGTNSSTITGAGAVSELYEIAVDKNDFEDEVYVDADNFNTEDEFLELIKGILHLNGNYNLTKQFFKDYSTTPQIPEFSGLWINNPNVTVTGQSGDLVMRGLLRLSTGEMNVGDASEATGNLKYGSDASYTPELSLESGTININNGISRSSDNSIIDFEMSGGNLALGVSGSMNSATRGLLDIGSSSSSFSWSAGTIELRRTNTGAFASGDYYINTTNGDVNGGLLLIDGDASAETYEMNSLQPVYELEMSGSNNSIVQLISNPLEIIDDITIAGAGSGRLDGNGQELILGGDWINNCSTSYTAYTANSGTVTFNGDTDQLITGDRVTTFGSFTVDKTGGNVILDNTDEATHISDNLLLLPNNPYNAIIDLNQQRLVFEENATIESNTGSTVFHFDTTRYILNSESGGEFEGVVQMDIPFGTISRVELLFPVGTDNVYTPAEIQFHAGQATFNNGANVSVTPIAEEHPAVEENDVTLKKYWRVETENIQLNPDLIGDADVIFYYDGSEVYGTEGEYHVLYFTPPHPKPGGYWTIDPGGAGNDIVDFNNRLFYSKEIKNVDGDWLAGEEDAAGATYFSRINGDYNDGNTWSKVGFGGIAAGAYPNKASDRVLIGDNDTVTINADIAPANVVAVQEDGTLIIDGDYVITGDTMRVDDDAFFVIGHKDGVHEAPTMEGCVQTDNRNFSEENVYRFIDASQSHQETGDGLPDIVSGLIVDKSPGDTLELGKHFSIVDSLKIIDGTLDIGSYSINGNSASRTFTMETGELIVRSSYPTNYIDNSFTSGTITFDGTGNTTIPSSGSSPGVDQYWNLKIAGNRNANITFAAEDSIYIANSLTTSSLSFTGAPSQRFQTDGSTVVFKKAGGVQDIPCRPDTPSDTVFNLYYYNLVVNGTGTKRLYAPGENPTFVVLNDITLESSTFELNGHNIETQGNWDNVGAIFDPGNSAVFLNSPVLTFKTYVTSRDTSENPFHDLLILGEGIVEPTDNILVRGDLSINNSSNLSLASHTLTLQGDWISRGNPLTYGTSTVHMTGAAQQTMSKTTGNEKFYDLIIDNPSDVDASGVGASSDDGVLIYNDINLSSGNLITRGRHATAYGTVTRPGASPGHIDGALCKIVDTASASQYYEVGYGNRYTPLELEFDGTGGSAGLIKVESDTITTASSPISWDNNNPDNILPAGHRMSEEKHVARQWDISIPTGSAFEIGPLRDYDVIAQFINPDDFRNGADPEFFEVRLWDGSDWVRPDRFDKPLTGTRTDTTTRYRMLEDFGTIMLGEPDAYSFYSIASKSWSDPTAWSTQSYGGPATSIAPTTDAYIYIGDSKAIGLDGNKTTDNEVTVDSSGTLLCRDYYLTSATGAFYLTSDAALGIGHSEGIRDAGNAGNIRTSVREYNYNNHNNGHFIYTGGSAQTQPNEALPQTVATLTVDKSANTATINRTDLTINDSLHFKNGTLAAGANFILKGNIFRENGGDFSAGTYTVTMDGDTTQYITNSSTSATLDFYNLTISKPDGNGIVTLFDYSPIEVENTLLFASGNDAIIDGQEHPGNYVTIPNGASLTRTGNGHIYGELRKYVPDNDAPAITFEVGDTTFYTPFTINFDDGSSDDGGLLGLNNIPGKHGRLDEADSPIDPARYLPRYWRLTEPSGSTFNRGTRDMTITLTFIDPDDIGLVDHPTCIEMGYWMGASERWQSLRPNTTNGNFGYGCSDTRFVLGDIDYDGSMTTLVANDIPDDTTFGSSETLPGGSTLLGEFVAGNQNSGITTIFYSRQDGDWTDGDTWSTTGYDGGPAGDYPQTQYDVAYVGDGKRVVLDENIGTNFLYNTGNYENDYYGPAVTVQNSGILNLGHHVLRGVGLTAEKGSTVEIGSHHGITTTGDGNVMSLSRTFEDSINVIYTAEGETPDLGGYPYNYCDPRNWSAGYRYITRVRVQDDTPTTIMDNNSGTTFKNQGYFYFFDVSAEMQEGEDYRLILTPDDANTRFWRVWIDFNRDGDFYDTGERVVSSSRSGEYTTGYFSIPNNLEPGVTRMRVQCRDGTSGSDPCTRGMTGEVEDYTVVIVNDDYQITQSTGSKLPDNLWSIGVRSPRASGSTVNLGKDLNVRDSVFIQSGVFNVGTRTIDLSGDFINDTTNGFNEGSSLIRFYREGNDTIRGTVSTTFNDIEIDKDNGKVVLSPSSATIPIEATLEGTLTFTSEHNFYLDNSTTFTIENGALVDDAGTGFSENKMFQTSGENNSGWLKKEFNTTAGAKAYVFPLGVDTIYNPADISITGSYSGTPTLSMQIHEGLHPNRLSDQILNKYWTLNIEDIANVSANEFKFHYEWPDTNGDADEYIPAVYTPSGWEINVGLSPKANPSPIEISNSTDIEGDWTAGDARGFFTGRKYYSRQTGDWDEAFRWSIVYHDGPPSSYYPGQLFVNDTVYIDGHTIDFNKDSVEISTIFVGGTYGGVGTLQMGLSPQDKSFRCSHTFTVNDDGVLSGDQPGTRYDTLFLEADFYNYSQAPSGGSVTLMNSPTNKTLMIFEGSGNSIIGGEGVWSDLSGLELSKAGGLSDSLIIRSATLSAATGSSPADFVYTPNGGVLKLEADAAFSIANGTYGIAMEPYTGFDVRDGTISSSSTMTTNVNTTINLDGGDFTIGDDADEGILYKTGTGLAIEDGFLDIAGCMYRFEPSSKIDFSMTANGSVRVLNQGCTDPNYIGFDISNTSSSFSMSGGEIIIADAIPGASADCRINAAFGAGMIGGEIQSGDATTAAATEIKIAGSMPVWDLHAEGNGSSDVTTQITQETFTVNNDLLIDDFNIFELRGNTIKLLGNLNNSGTFDATTGSGVADPRLVVLSGSSNTQTIYNENAGGIEMWNLRIDKTGGKVLLGNAPGDNSNVMVKKTLEFATDNVALIDSRTNGLYVDVSPATGVSSQILRNGLGHIDGRLYRYVEENSQSVAFAIGSSTVSGYRPSRFTTVGNGGVAGKIGMIVHDFYHPHIGDAGVIVDSSVQVYWNVAADASFDLGTRTFELTTYFLNPEDMGGSQSDTLYYEHHLYEPACPDPPTPCPATGSWSSLITLDKRSNYVKSVYNTEFGDIIIAEAEGIPFYSINDGNWNDMNNWSTVSYESGINTYNRYPGEGGTSTDRVFIGNGKEISVPVGLAPLVRSIQIEKYNGQPGALYIEDNIGAVRGTSFILNDSCTLGVMHLNGIAPSGESAGAILTDSRSYGVSNYIFNNSEGAQNTGKGLPDTVASIFVDIPTPEPNSCFITALSGAANIKIRDSIKINRGKLNCGNRNLHLYGNYIMLNNAEFEPQTSTFHFAGPAQHTVSLGNQEGLSFYDCELNGGGHVLVDTVSGVNANNAHIYIDNDLIFSDPAVINVRNSDRKVIVQTGGTLTQAIPGEGYVDGALVKPVGSADGTYTFEIGNGSATYTPAVLDFDNSGGDGTAGLVEAINLDPLPDEFDNNPSAGHRMDPNHSIPRYWRIEPFSGGTFDIGNRELNARLYFPQSELSTVSTSDAVVRRRGIPAESPEWDQRGYDIELQWYPADDPASVELQPTADLWAGIGEFYVGQKFPRTFYSLTSGSWTNNEVWTFDPSHMGISAPPNVYPNNEEFEFEDNVEIGDSGGSFDHEISITTSSATINIDTLRIQGTSRLNLGTNYLYNKIPGRGSFSLFESGKLGLGGSLNPDIGTFNGFDFYYLPGPGSPNSTNTTIIFMGTQTLTPTPFGVPDALGYYGNVEVTGTGTKRIDLPLRIQGNLYITNQALLEVNSIDALKVNKNIYNSATLRNSGIIEIGD